MARTLESFAVSRDGFSFPITDVLTGRGFITGKSGSGKSNTASVIAEELLARGLTILIVDTDGEYYGLKEHYEVLHVGGHERCDLDIGETNPAEITELALDENVPIILDVSGFLDEEVAHALVHDVAKELFIAEKERKKPFLLLVEEAHEFVPEQGGSSEVSRMLIRIAKRGRKRGLGICGMSQRPAAVSKDFITQCDWLVWHRLTWENDTAVAERILGGNTSQTVQGLNDGEALVMTDWDETIDRVQFRRKRTHDAGATPDLEDSRRSASARREVISDVRGDDSFDQTDLRDDDVFDQFGRSDQPIREVGDHSSTTDDFPSTIDHSPSTTDDRNVTGAAKIQHGDDRPPVDDRPPSGGHTSTIVHGLSEDGPISLNHVTVSEHVASVEQAGGGEPNSPASEEATADAGVANTDGGYRGKTVGADDVATLGRRSRRGARERSIRRRHRDTHNEYDPLWELAEMVVHLFRFLVRSNQWLVDVVQLVVLKRMLRARNRIDGGGRTLYSRGASLERRLSRLLSLVLVTGFYAGLFVVVLLLA